MFNKKRIKELEEKIEKYVYNEIMIKDQIALLNERNMFLEKENKQLKKKLANNYKGKTNNETL